jgi:hypothetical protein
MTCALVTYRDYFASVNRCKGTKTESLHQYVPDLAKAVGEKVEIVPTCKIGRDVDLNDFDSIIIFQHPTSTLNGPLGFTTPNISIHARQLRSIVEFKNQVWTCGVTQSDWDRWTVTMLKRSLKPTEKHLLWPNKEELAALGTSMMEGDITKKYEKVRNSRKNVALGDSHATMLWKPGRTVKALFGKTLFSSLQSGLETLVRPDLEQLSLCFGNIDLRHHILRYPNTEQMVLEMAEEYVKQAQFLAKEVSICSLLPEISLSHEVKKAYWHKGTSSFGLPEERIAIAKKFRENLLTCSKGTNVTIVDPPKSIVSNDWFKEECLETRGLHLRTDCYEWCAETGCHKPEFTFNKIA